MDTRRFNMRVIVAACSLAMASLGGIAIAANTGTTGTTATEGSTSANQSTTGANASGGTSMGSSDAQSTMRQVTEATKVVKEMEKNEQLKKVLQQAQGIFILPDYGRVALGIGGRGGQGVVLVKQGGKWSDPAFYNFGGVSAGLQAGAETGAVAMILNNQKAVDSFKKENNWSLNADAGLTVVNWTEKMQASAGKGDVIVWSNAKGLLGDIAVSITDINFDQDQTAAFYGKKVTQQDVFGGKVKAPSQVAALKQALPSGSAATSSGASPSSDSSSGSSSGASSTGAAASGTGNASESSTSSTSGVHSSGSSPQSDSPAQGGTKQDK